MATPTTTQLFAAYPELTTVDADELTLIGTLLGHTTSIVGDSGFSSAAKVLEARLAVGGHFTWLFLHRTQKHGGGGLGTITGRTMSGGSTVSYSDLQVHMSEQAYKGTKFGLAYLMLQQSNAVRLPRVGGMTRRRRG